MEIRVQSPRTHVKKLDTVKLGYNPSAGESKTGGSLVFVDLPGYPHWPSLGLGRDLSLKIRLEA